jgi:very-short-patch-repair endonuclease
MATSKNPPRHGVGDRAKRGGGGSRSLQRPETYTARRLRREMSLPEVLMWQRLRIGHSGLKFRKQHRIGPYIVDFYCAAAHLIVEADGIAHDMGDRPARDGVRDRYLGENGYTVIRLPASEVLKDADGVAAAVVQAASPLHRPADGPPPRAGEDLS